MTKGTRAKHCDGVFPPEAPSRLREQVAQSMGGDITEIVFTPLLVFGSDERDINWKIDPCSLLFSPGEELLEAGFRPVKRTETGFAASKCREKCTFSVMIHHMESSELSLETMNRAPRTSRELP